MADIKKLYMGPTSTQELINLIKADLAKKQDIIQFTKLPAPEDAVGRCYEYVGPTTMEFTNGHLYHSDGFTWEEVYKGQDGKTWQVVASLPPYDDADFDTIYFIYRDGKVEGYIKGPEQMDLITSTNTWKMVTNLPAWADARIDTLYLLLEGDTLKGCLKNPNTVDEWYEMGGGKTNFNELENTPTINGLETKNTIDPRSPKELVLSTPVQKYPDSAHWDKDAVYPDEPTDIPVTELGLTAFTDTRLKELWEEVDPEDV